MTTLEKKNYTSWLSNRGKREEKKKKSPPYALVIHLENLKRTVIELQEGFEVDRVATEMEIMFASRADDAIPSGVCDAGGRFTGKPQRPT